MKRKEIFMLTPALRQWIRFSLTAVLFVFVLSLPVRAQLTCANVPMPPVDPISLFAASANDTYSETARVADIDGDGKLDVLARGADGIHLWHFDTKAYEFIQAPIATILTGPPWDLPLYHRSIRLIDVTGDGRPELLAKGPNGLLAWQFDSTNESWLPLQSVDATTLQNAYDEALTRPTISLRDSAPLPAFTGTQLAIYQYISGQLSPGSTDIRAQYTDLTHQEDWLADYYSNLSNLPIPSQYTSTDWTPVKTQLLTEFGYVGHIITWFNLLGGLYTDEGIENTISAITVANYLSIPNPTNNGAKIGMDVLTMIANLGGKAINAAGGPPLGTIFSALMTSAMKASYNVVVGPNQPNLIAEVSTLDQKLGVLFSNSLVANGCQLNSYLTDWDMMQNMGEGINSGKISWGTNTTGSLALAEKATYETSLLQTLTPVIWEIQQRCSNPNHVCEGPPTQYKLWIASKGGYLFISLKGHAEDPPPDSTQGNLFEQPPTGVGATVSEVMQNQNGWNMSFGGVCATLTETSRRQTVTQTQALLQNVTSTLDAGASQDFLTEPLQLALHSLQQGLSTKGSSVTKLADNSIKIFRDRTGNPDLKLSSSQIAQWQNAANTLRGTLLPTTEAHAKAASRTARTQGMPLDGSDSASVDGAELKYFWSSVGPRRARFNSRTAATPTMRFADGPGKYKVQLTVQDTFGYTSSDVITIDYQP